MKKQFTYTSSDLNKIKEHLEGAKRILDGDSALRILACKAAIDNALRELDFDEEERCSEE